MTTLINDSPDVLLVLDVESLRVVDVNRGEEGAFGYPRLTLLALDAFSLFPRWWDAEKTLKPGAAVATFVKLADGVEQPADIRLSRSRDSQGREVILAAVRMDRALSEVEKELADVNTYLHAIVENIPDMIFVKDAESHAFRRFNRAGEELLGFTRGELLGKTDHDFYPKEQADFFHQKDRDTILAHTIVDIPVEPIQTKFKGERMLHTRKIPIYDDRGKPLYLLGISEDITERIKAEQVAREFADVVRYLRDAVVSWKPDGRIASWNPAAERLYGVSAEQVFGLPFERFVPDAELLAFRQRVEALLQGREVEVTEVLRLGASGREIEVEESTFAILDTHGHVQRIASIARDLSELARLRRVTQALSEAAAPTTNAAHGPVSPIMAEVLHTAELAARDRDATVLLLGETGAGKSWIARRIHQQSPRADKPFFEINCAGLSPQLVESELFGHERGAFTGAMAQKRGLVETAEGGTLFLDEVAELSPAIQAELLTFIDTRRFRRVGGMRTLSSDVRLVAATNVDLKTAVEAGRFRRDLFYRLSVVPIRIPPLRERIEEIQALASDVLAEFGRRSGRYHQALRKEVIDALVGYSWPGNIRELRNTLERALILCAGGEIEVRHLPMELHAPIPGGTPPTSDTLDLGTLERTTILRMLEECEGNRTRAAERLGISRSTLKRKLASMRADEQIRERR